MALVRCEKCGEMYANTYKNCPFCAEDEAFYGGKVKKKKVNRRVEKRAKAPSIVGPALVLVIFVAAVGLIWVLFGENFSNSIRITKSEKGKEQAEFADEITEEAEVITLGQDSLLLIEGESEILTVTGSDSYSWSSSDPTVASVSESGEVTAISAGAEGQSTVMISVVGPNGGTDVCTVTVQVEGYDPNAPEEEVDYSKYEILTSYGTYLPKVADGKFQISMATNEAVEFTVTGTEQNVVWSTSDDSFATITENGTCKKVSSGVGSATIYGKFGKATIEIQVTNN